MIDGRRIKPISYFKAHAAEMLKDLKETGKPYVITQKGEGKAILLDIHEYERQREAITLLKILNLGDEDISAGRTISLEEADKQIRKEVFREAE